MKICRIDDPILQIFFLLKVSKKSKQFDTLKNKIQFDKKLHCTLYQKVGFHQLTDIQYLVK